MPELFAGYTGQQVAPVAPGTVQAVAGASADLARGMSQFGQDVGQGIANWKQMQMQSKAADYMVKSYEQKAPDGTTVNPMLDKMGLHPEQWATLGAREKTMAVQGIMKGMAAQSQQQEMQAKTGQLQSIANENQARAMMLQQQSDEATAMSAIAPKAADWAKANPGKQATPTDILGWMGDAKLNPRTQAAVLTKLIPSMMGTAATVATPQAWTSPQNNHYVFMDHTLTPDRAPATFDPSKIMPQQIKDADGNIVAESVQNPDGTTKMLPPPKAPKSTVKTLPESFMSAYNGSSNNFGLKKEFELAKDPAAKTAMQGKIKDLFDLYRSEGYGTPETWSALYAKHGLPAPDGKPPAPAAGGGASASGRVAVWKDGKQFTVPAGQKDAAVKAGYSLTK